MRDTPDVIGTWGPNIAKARRARKLTQEALGREIGVAGFTVSRWETGDLTPSLENQLRLSEWFDLTVTEMFPRSTAEADLVVYAELAQAAAAAETAKIATDGEPTS